MKWVFGKHEQFKDIEGIEMNYVTTTSEAQLYKYEEDFRNKGYKLDHIRETKGISGEPVWYLYYTYEEEA